jgi:hypothetical protein
MGHREEELMKMNMTMSCFSGEASNAKGMIAKELTIGSKSKSTVFFVLDVKGKNNVLLGRDWIHTNICVPSTLHQCGIQWVGDEVEIIKADDSACVALAKIQDGLHDGEVKCLMGQDLLDFDYVSVGKNSFVPVKVKPMLVTQLENMSISNAK